LERETKTIQEIISASATDEEPFFIFTNSVHLHYPYVPAEAYQKKHLGSVMASSELRRLNEEVAQNRAFERLVECDAVDMEDVKKIRNLYAAAVEETDIAFRNILQTLRETGQVDNTVIIFAADHGEDLGERDYTGRRRFGHGNSISDAVCRVPLGIYHPSIMPETITDPVSLTEIYDIIKKVTNPHVELDNDAFFDVSPDPVLCEFPAAGGYQTYRTKHPDLRDEYVERRTKTDLVAVYTRNRRVIGDSTGDRVSFYKGTRKNEDNIPSEVETLLSDALADLVAYNLQTLDEESIEHLEDMGYI
jgi:hypothetical protein